MSETVVSVNALPETVLRYFLSGQVKVREEDGIVTLTPVKKDFPGSRLFGMFADGRMSTEKYVRQKQLDKELEG